MPEVLNRFGLYVFKFHIKKIRCEYNLNPINTVKTVIIPVKETFHTIVTYAIV